MTGPRRSRTRSAWRTASTTARRISSRCRPAPTTLFANVQTVRVLCAGPVDLRPADAAGRRPLRSAEQPFLDQHVGPDRWIPTAGVLPAQDGVKGYNDLTPRLGASYDLFGNGKTAIKFESRQIRGRREPHRRLLRHQSAESHRPQHDAVVDRRKPELRRRLQSPESGAAGPARHGRRFLRRHGEPDLRDRHPDEHLRSGDSRGMERAPAQLDSSASSVQHELLPRLSVLAAYNRRWFTNFLVTDNLAVTRRATTRRSGHRAVGSSSARWRRIRRCRALRRQPAAVRPDEKLHHRGQQLRRSDSVLAGRRSDGQRASGRRAHPPGRLQHRADGDRQLRDRGRSCRRPTR